MGQQNSRLGSCLQIRFSTYITHGRRCRIQAGTWAHACSTGAANSCWRHLVSYVAMWHCSGQRMGDEDYQRHKIDYSASVWHLFCIAIIGVRSCHSEGMGGSEGSLAAEQLIILLCDLGSDRSNAPSDQSAKLPTRSDQRWLILLYFLKKTKFVIEMTSWNTKTGRHNFATVMRKLGVGFYLSLILLTIRIVLINAGWLICRVVILYV